MDKVIIDYLFVFFALVFYALLIVVYLLRAHQSDLEWKLSKVFSLQLIPFTLLWTVNLFIGNNSGRIVAGLPIIFYLAYDFWYRLITRKKPHHHPDRWPIGLIIYLLLLFLGSISLNWYGYLVSNVYGITLVISFFIMISSFGYYQYRYSRRKKLKRIRF